MRPKTAEARPERRAKYAAQLRGFIGRWTERYSGRFPDQLARLERGEAVEIQGWEIGEALPDLTDDQTWILEPDGSLVVAEVIYVDPTVKVKTTLNYRRPDGSLVLSGARS